MILNYGLADNGMLILPSLGLSLTLSSDPRVHVEQGRSVLLQGVGSWDVCAAGCWCTGSPQFISQDSGARILCS